MLAIDDVVAVSARAAAVKGEEAARRGLVRNGVAGSAQLRLRYEHVAHGVKGSGGEVAGRLLERECAAEPVVELGEEQRLRGAVRASHHRDKKKNLNSKHALRRNGTGAHWHVGEAEKNFISLEKELNKSEDASKKNNLNIATQHHNSLSQQTG